MVRLDRRAALVCLDGVLCQGEHLLPGAQSFMWALIEMGIPFLLLSNDSWRTIEQWQKIFRRNGVDLFPEHFLTSAQAATLCLTATAPPGARAMVIGGSGLVQELQSHGLVIVDRTPDIVAVGHDPLVSYGSLTRACHAVAHGALLVGTNADRTIVADDGTETPGPGASLAWIESVTGHRAVVMGMPQPLMYHLALERLGCSVSETTLIGDGLDTEIHGAQKMQIHTVVVLSGRATVSAIRRTPVKPDRIIRDIGDLLPRNRQSLRPWLHAVR